VGPSPIQVTLDTHTVEIDWGDGSTTTKLDLAAGVLTFDPESHQYLDDPAGTPDVYTISVKVTDKDNADVTKTQAITVNNVAPTAAIVGAPTSSPEGTEIGLTSTVTDPGTLDTFTYAWSVTKDTVAYGTGGTGATFDFTPDDNGAYVVTFIATTRMAELEPTARPLR